MRHLFENISYQKCKVRLIHLLNNDRLLVFANNKNGDDTKIKTSRVKLDKVKKQM